MVWTSFSDMCSGGGEKTEYDPIYIEGDEEEACSIFEAKFNRDPRNVTCSCCGPDFSVWEHDGGLDEATLAARTCGPFGGDAPVIPLDEYLANPCVLVIRKDT